MNPYTATRLPDIPSFADQIMLAAEQAPRENRGGGAGAKKLLNWKDRRKAMSMYRHEMPVAEIARHFGVSEGQIRNCVV